MGGHIGIQHAVQIRGTNDTDELIIVVHDGQTFHIGMCPRDANDLGRIVAGVRGIAVIDQNLSMGSGGVLHSEIASALYGQRDAPRMLLSFIGGLGGRDISPEELFEIAAETSAAVDSGRTPPPRLLYTAEELREIRKLQAIAEVERWELE